MPEFYEKKVKVRCQTCGGTGKRRRVPFYERGVQEGDKCGHCGGVGWVPRIHEYLVESVDAVSAETAGE